MLTALLLLTADVHQRADAQHGLPVWRPGRSYGRSAATPRRLEEQNQAGQQQQAGSTASRSYSRSSSSRSSSSRSYSRSYSRSSRSSYDDDDDGNGNGNGGMSAGLIIVIVLAALIPIGARCLLVAPRWPNNSPRLPCAQAASGTSFTAGTSSNSRKCLPRPPSSLAASPPLSTRHADSRRRKTRRLACYVCLHVDL